MNTQQYNNYGNVPMGQGNPQWSNPPAGPMPYGNMAPAPAGYGGNVPPAGPPASPPSGGDPNGSKRRRTIVWIIVVALLNLLLFLLWLLLPSRCSCDRHHHDNNDDDKTSVVSSDDRHDPDDDFFDSIPDDPDRVVPNDSVRDDVEEIIEQGGQLQFTISWERSDFVDIDAHCYEPGYHIYYPNKRVLSPSGGVLDVDNLAESSGRIEHITYENCSSMRNGTYTFAVMNYSGGSNRGINAYLTVNGRTYQYRISSLTQREQEVKVAQVTVNNGQVTNVNHLLSATEVDVHP